MDSSRSTKLLWIIVIILTIGAFSPSLLGDFVWDDHAVITDNEQMRESALSLLTKPFAAAKSRGYWRPLTALTLWLDYRIGQGSPLPFRLFNLIAHLISVLLFCALLNKLLPQKPFVVWTSGLLFALHPAHGESVGWIVGRTNVLAGLFTLATIALAQGFIKSGKRAFWLFSLTTFLLGLFSKESASMALLLVPLVAWAIDLEAEEKRRTLHWFLSGLVLFFLWSGARYLVLGSFSRDLTGVAFAQLSPFQRIPLAIAVLGRYTQLAFFPYEILPVYPGSILPSAWSLSDWTFLGLLAIVLGLIIISVLYWKREPFVTTGFLWFFVCLAPVSQLLLVLNFPIAVRCLYLPLMGWSLGVALLLQEIPLPKLRMAIVTLLILFFVLSLQDNCHMWSNDVKLWQSCIQRRQGQTTLRVLIEMGLAYSKSGQADLAMQWYEKAEALNETKFDLQVKMARAQMQMGHVKRAANRLRRHLEKHPNDKLAKENLEFLIAKVGHKATN